MANLNNIAASSGISTWPEEKYYDLYTNVDYKTNACNGSSCKGHALNELAGWYSDVSHEINSTNPFIIRGGHYNDNQYAGSIAFHLDNGRTNSDISFRLVLTPNN